MLLRLVLVAVLAASPVAAQTSAPIEGQEQSTAPVAALSEALRLPDLFAVLRDEGLAYGATLETDMFPGGGGARWREGVSAIYDADTLTDRFVAVLQQELANHPDATAEATAFFASDLGRRVVELEIAARRAFLDEATEEAARVAAEDRQEDRDPKVPLLDRFIAASDLIEMNVAGGLSANLAFMTGMLDSGAYPGLPAEDMLADIWGQEAEVRASTTTWLYSFLGLAYQPLTEAELLEYVEFYESEAGQRFNAALFAAYDQVFRQVSYDLGRAAGVAMLGQDI
jgi:hypothetical protein